MNFVDVFLMDHWLNDFMNDWLMLFMHDLFVLLNDNIFMMLMNYVLMLFLNDSSLDMGLNNRCIYVFLDLSL